jgi:hypothetical protein
LEIFSEEKPPLLPLGLAWGVLHKYKEKAKIVHSRTFLVTAAKNQGNVCI